MDLDPSLLAKWRWDPHFNEVYVTPLLTATAPSGDLEQENRQLRKTLGEMILERDILKKVETGTI